MGGGVGEMKGVESGGERGYHMSPEQFRADARLAADWIADYWERIEELPVFPDVRPGDLRRALPARAPEHGEPFEAVLRDMSAVIEPHSVHWQSPNFFAYFAANTSGPSVLGEMFASAMNSVGFQWACNPAAAELEMQMLDWLVEMLGLPGKFSFGGGGGGVIQDTSSTAALCAVVAARERLGEPYDRLTAYVTSESHSSVEKGIKLAGFSAGNVRRVGVDGGLAMRADELGRLMAADAERGLVPCFVGATLGTTSTGAVDPVEGLGRVSAEHGAWLHVDAAMAGSALICPENRHHAAGLELAQSFSFNPHKWLFTNVDCCCMFVGDKAAYTRAFANDPEYLANDYSAAADAVDYRNWTSAFGRRIRALKLWFVIRHYGVEGLRHHVRRHIELARVLRDWIEADDDFELTAPMLFNLVCFRHKGGEELNKRLLKALNESGRMHLTHTRAGGEYMLRMHISQMNTEARHVEAAWGLVRRTAGELSGEVNKEEIK